MMWQRALSELLAEVSARKADLGFDEEAEAIKTCRNKGMRRTANRATIPERAQERVHTAGRELVVISYLEMR